MNYLQKEKLDFEDNFALAKIENNLQLKDCLSAELMVNQKDQELNFVKSIYSLVTRFNDLINVGKKLNESQMMQLAMDLFQRFKCETLEDVALFFKMAREGQFSDFYRLDSAVVMKWVDVYLDKKAEAFEDEMRNQENIRRRQENDAVANHVPDEKAKENLKKLSEMLKGASQRTIKIEKENPLFDYTAYCDKLQLEVGKMTDDLLQKMYSNTSKFTHKEVWGILNTEIELRKELEKNKKIAKKK